MKFPRRRTRGRAKRLARGLVPMLPRFLRLLGGLVADRRVSAGDKALLLGVVAYVLLPVDLVPDVLGVLGLTDDLFLLALAVRRLITRAGRDVVEDHWHGSRRELRDLEAGLEGLGSLLPGPVRRALESLAGRS